MQRSLCCSITVSVSSSIRSRICVFGPERDTAHRKNLLGRRFLVECVQPFQHVEPLVVPKQDDRKSAIARMGSRGKRKTGAGIICRQDLSHRQEPVIRCQSTIISIASGLAPVRAPASNRRPFRIVSGVLLGVGALWSSDVARGTQTCTLDEDDFT